MSDLCEEVHVSCERIVHTLLDASQVTVDEIYTLPLNGEPGPAIHPGSPAADHRRLCTPGIVQLSTQAGKSGEVEGSASIVDQAEIDV